MASSNFPNRPFRLEESVNLVSQNIATNSSRIRAQLLIYKNSYSPTASASGSSFNFMINGATRASSNNFGFNFVNSDSLLLATVEVDIPHNPDGTGSFTVGGYCTADILGYTQVESGAALPTIPRQSTSTFTGGSTFDAGSPVTINTNRAVGTYTHTLTWDFGTLQNQTIATGVGASYAWTPPLTMLQQMPNGVQGNGTLKTLTYSGSTLIGTTSTTFYLRAPASVVPTIPVPTIAEQNATVASVVGAYVQGVSVAKVTATAAGAQGSTISSLGVSIGGAPVANGSNFLLTSSGTNNVVVSAVDSRARTATRTTPITVLPYTDPTVSAFSAQRATSTGVPSSDGAYLRFDLTAAVASLVNSTQRNSMTITVRTRPSGGAWTTRNVINTALTYNSGALITGGAAYLTTASYDVQVTVADKVGRSYIAQTTVTTTAVTLDLNGRQVGVGKFHEQGALDVAGDIYQSGQVVIDASDVATATARGIVELATVAETQAGVDTERAVTPAGVRAAIGGILRRVNSSSASTGNQAISSATPVEITGMSVPVTLLTTSTIVVTFACDTYSADLNAVGVLRIRDESTTLGDYTFGPNSAGGTAGTTATQYYSAEFTLTAGSHRINVACFRAAGAGVLTVTKSAAGPARLTVDQFI